MRTEDYEIWHSNSLYGGGKKAQKLIDYGRILIIGQPLVSSNLQLPK